MCPFGGRLITGVGPVAARGRMIARVFVVETKVGLLLVDTGFGTEDAKRLPTAFRAITSPKLDPSETALARLRELGLRAEDVSHVVVTHLDLDHAGGISDFPKAQVHVHDRELDAALARATLAEKRRYIPAQWAHGPQWVRHREDGETWNGLDAVKAIPGLDDDVLLIPMHGHTRGHSAVAVKSDAGWVVHAGDAYFHRWEMEEPPRCPKGLAIFQGFMAVDDVARKKNQARLRTLSRVPGVRVVSAHDPEETAS